MTAQHFKAVRLILLIGVVGVSLQSCKDLLGNIYDKPENTDKFGFIHSEGNSGIIYINSTDYSMWTYIDLHDRKIQQENIATSEIADNDWDIAIHRYDAKTNGCLVADTSLKDIKELKEMTGLPEESFIPDVWSKVAIDMSDMINDNIKYSESYVNKVLSRWLTVDTSTMPPIYTLSGNFYIVRLSDKTLAAVKLRDFISPSGDKGYMTIEYIYPFNWKE